MLIEMYKRMFAGETPQTKTAEENIEGGIGDDVDLDKFPKDQIEKGIKVEMEHTDSPAEAEEIVADHLQEEVEESGKDPRDVKYYDELANMEEKLMKSGMHLDFIRGFLKSASEYRQERRFPGRRSRKKPVGACGGKPGKETVRGGRGPGKGPTKMASASELMLKAAVRFPTVKAVSTSAKSIEKALEPKMPEKILRMPKQPKPPKAPEPPTLDYSELTGVRPQYSTTGKLKPFGKGGIPDEGGWDAARKS